MSNEAREFKRIIKKKPRFTIANISQKSSHGHDLKIRGRSHNMTKVNSINIEAHSPGSTIIALNGDHNFPAEIIGQSPWLIGDN